MSDQLPHDEELRSLYRKLPADEPRAEIDEAILAAAREVAEAAERERAAGVEHERHRRRFLGRASWMIPLAAAASVILTVTLTRLTPEQPAVEPSSLQESASPAGQDPAADDEGEMIFAEEAPMEAPPPVAEEAPVAEGAPEPRAPAAAAPASPALAAREAQPGNAARALPAEEAQAAKKAEADTAARARLSKDKLAEEKKAAESRRQGAPGGAAVPDAAGQAAMADAPRDAEQARKLKSLGYLRGDPSTESPAESAPAAPAAPPVASAGSSPAASAPAPPPAASAPASPPTASAPASPPVDALSPRDDGASKRNDDHQAFRDYSFAKSAPGRKRRAAAAEWPFGLAPRMDANEACRLIEAALKTTCRYQDDTAVVAPQAPAVIDRGEFAEGKTTRITLFAVAGRLASVHLAIEGFASEQILIAPAEP